MWNKPWRYREGIAISIGLLITGALLQATIGPLEWGIFMWPANIITLCLLIVVLMMFYVLRSKVYLFRFMTQVEAAVPALAIASLLTIIMGLTFQVPEGHSAIDPIGISNMLSFWPFVLIYLWSTIIVAEVSIHQIMHFRKHFIPSLISHLGLFIFITCGVLGSADMQRMKMYCEEGNPEWRALDNYQNVHELPFAIELEKFTIDEYPPKLALFDSNTGKSLPLNKPQNIIIEPGFRSGELLGWTITVEKYIEDAIPAAMLTLDTGGYVEYKDKGAATAILVKVQKGSEVKRGWISSGSYMFPMSSLRLDDRTELAMSNREPLRYASDIHIYCMDGSASRAHIEVNKPFTLGSWKIYQFDFNKEQGKWSTLSVYELISDPWLPAVYVGIYLLLLGAVLMFISAGREKYKKEEDKR